MKHRSRAGKSIRFHDLMWHRISEVLLVSSPYDAFILEQDGQLTEQVFREYSKLSLPAPPRFTHAPTGEEAIRLLKLRRFDLVLTMTSLADMDVNAFGRKVKKLRQGRPVVLLALDRKELYDLRGVINKKAIDGAFLWTGDSKILLAIIKYIEDRENLDLDIQHGHLKVIIVLEDSPYYYSLFLSLLYKELTAQALSLYAEGANEIMRQMSMKSRPKVLLATTYEEGVRLFERYKKNLLAIISDMGLPRGSMHDPLAGLDFVRMARKFDPDLPVLLQSAEEEHKEAADDAQAGFIHKTSPQLLAAIRNFLTSSLGFGDFVFRLPDGREFDRAHDLRELEEKLADLPTSSLAFHAQHNHFSIWLVARSEFDLARKIRPRRMSEFDNLEQVRQFLVSTLRDGRHQTRRGVVTDFSRKRFDREPYTRLGHGSLGGKARGLAFFNMLLADLGPEDFGGLSVSVPKMVALTTDHFDAFMGRNNLRDFAIHCKDDKDIVRLFLDTRLPDELADDLAFILEHMTEPLAVRSSSLLEDSMHQRLAGIYNTLMLPNNAPEPSRRLREVCDAVKLVWASTFSSNARAYLKNTGKHVGEEKMGVIIQELAGSYHEDRFYPDFSGVVQSYNFYPIGPQNSEDGVAHMALGFGRIVVDGGLALRFSPKHPEVLPQFAKPKTLMDRSQRGFYALDMQRHCCTTDADLFSTMSYYDLDVAEADGTLKAVGSIYDPDEQRISDNLRQSGPRVITFNNILKHKAIPLPEALLKLLELGQEGFGGAVEIELAVNMGDWGRRVPHGATRQEPHLHVLQVRPFASSAQMTTGPTVSFPPDDVLCATERSLGNGVSTDILDIVYVRYDRWEAAKNKRIADEVGKINEQLGRLHRPYLLIGPGRWGTSDEWLGIPVDWGQISNARVIVEASPQGYDVEPSQGTHFFQNITALEVAYLTLPAGRLEADDSHFLDLGWLDLGWLDEHPAHEETENLRWLHLAEPVTTVLRGRHGRGVIAKPGAKAQ